MKPVIGITATDTVRENFNGIANTYVEAVVKAGGIPVLIPIIEGNYEEYIDALDGIIFSGGKDVAPLFYGEEPTSQLNYTSIKRDEFEIGLFKEAHKKGLAILGICRGLQLMNVAFKGDLYQDLKDQVKDVLGHNPKQGSSDIHHSIKLEDMSILREALGEDEVFVNSYHHQAIKNLGEGLKVTARSKDGIIEGVEGTGESFLLGVQFHPEDLVDKYPKFLNVFRKLIEAAMEGGKIGQE